MAKTNTQTSTMDKSTSGLDSRYKNKKKSAACQSLEELFEKDLRLMYSGEKQLTEALPKLAKAADSEDLEDAFNDHLQETRRQVERLEKVFDRLDLDKNEEKTCHITEMLVENCDHVISDYEQGPLRDSALISAAQKVEHHEMAGYESLCELAEALGYHKVCEILDRSLQEEKNANDHLAEIIQNINDEACELQEEEEEVM